MNKQISQMIVTLSEWLKLLELGGHAGGHDDCPNCQRYWGILKAWSAMDDLADFVKMHGEDDEVTR